MDNGNLEEIEDTDSSSDSSSSSDEEIDYSNIRDLPVSKYRAEIIETLKTNQVVIINGQTGCGKTTQLPQYLLEAGLQNHGTIGITQPRRMAAISIAKRIAKEMKCSLGREVGYQIRFDTKMNSGTKIKVMTEGILLNEIQSDKKLHDYGVIIADEVHERSINSDLLLGLLKKVVSKRKDLKVIICSATISSEKFSHYFNDAAIITIEGRRFPIEDFYAKHEIKEKYIVEESVRQVKKIIETEKGDILIFFPGEDEILSCCEKLEAFENVEIFPLYASMGIEAQNKVFKPAKNGYRKIVVATNIAETSITIDGIKFVIDSGYVKESGFQVHLDLQTLDNVPVSQAQANQRLGRAGRTSPGVCYRLYRKKDFNKLSKEPIPEILRENLMDMYLRLRILDLDPKTFDYLDVPKPESLRYAKDELMFLSLLDSDDQLTTLGKNVANLPIEPKLGKLIWTSADKESFFEILCISAMLTERFIFRRPWKDRPHVEVMQRSFDVVGGDHFTLLKLYQEWKLQDNQRKWCRKYFISLHVMKEVDLIVEQLASIMTRNNFLVRTQFRGNEQEIKKSFLSVFLKNVCFIRDDQRGKSSTKLYDEQYFRVFPGSSFARVGVAEVALFCQAFKIKAKFCNQTMALEPEIMTGFEEELKLIGFKEKMDDPNSILS